MQLQWRMGPGGQEEGQVPPGFCQRVITADCEERTPPTKVWYGPQKLGVDVFADFELK